MKQGHARIFIVLVALLPFILIFYSFLTNLPATAQKSLEITKSKDKKLTPHKIKEVTFRGNITAGYTYDIQMMYVATKGSYACTSYSLFSGRTGKVKYFHYPATIENGKHSITFPFNELPLAQDCHWKPSTVAICLTPDGTPNKHQCSQLLDIGRSSTTSRAIPIEEYHSSAENPIKLRCDEVSYDPGYWWCAYTAVPTTNGTKSPYALHSQLLIFSGFKGSNYPFERDDTYWLDLDLFPAGS